LRQRLRARGHDLWHLVGRKRGDDPRVVRIPDDDRRWARVSGYSAAQSRLHDLAARHPGRGFGVAGRVLRLATHPAAVVAELCGDEDFVYPGSERCLERLPQRPSVLHLHNLHGGYFDLRVLPRLSWATPSVVTLHDMWMLTGHCAHSLECDRWRHGCGACGALHLDPPVRRDRTAENWARKRAIYAASRLHLVTPSAWLRSRVEQSMLGSVARSIRVIPNGVDTAVFSPGDRDDARRRLGLAPDRHVVMVTTGWGGEAWKDDALLAEAAARLAERSDVLFLTVGRRPLSPARFASHHLPWQADPARVAECYRAADVYLHASRADTCPLAVLEAMSCGTAIVASNVGGIAEQLGSNTALPAGVLIDRRDADAMASAAHALLRRPEERRALGTHARARVLERFDVEQQIDAYEDVYRQIAGEDAARHGMLNGDTVLTPASAEPPVEATCVR